MVLAWSTILRIHTVLAAPVVYAELVTHVDRTVKPLRMNSRLSFFFSPRKCLCMPTRCSARKSQINRFKCLFLICSSSRKITDDWRHLLAEEKSPLFCYCLRYLKLVLWGKKEKKNTKICLKKYGIKLSH